MGSEYPYQASQTPETKLVEHNGATFHTALWVSIVVWRNLNQLLTHQLA